MLWTYVINDLNREEIVGTFYKKKLQKTNQKEFRTEKVIKRKGDKLHMLNGKMKIVKWIDKKDIFQNQNLLEHM